MQALLVGSQRDSVTQAQLEPFLYLKKQLVASLGLNVRCIRAETIAEIQAVYCQEKSDIAFIFPFWREEAAAIETALKQMREKNPSSKIAFVDPWAQATSRYFNVLPYVDYFLKRQCYRDVNLYQQKFVGGSLFTQYISQQPDFDLNGWHVDSDVPDGCQSKIIPGWNLGTAKKFRDRLFPSPIWLFNRQKKQKDIDIFCRLSLGSGGKREWYSEYRARAVEALEPLNSTRRLAGSGGFIEKGLVPRRQYEDELKRSKLVFSPFGWGETCWRDFEAICDNCLLIKPDMSHIRTEPNIFVDGETYVSVKWDFSDLLEKCNYYLENETERERIASNARQNYKDYFLKNKFVSLMGELIG